MSRSKADSEKKKQYIGKLSVFPYLLELSLAPSQRAPGYPVIQFLGFLIVLPPVTPTNYSYTFIHIYTHLFIYLKRGINTWKSLSLGCILTSIR